MNPRDYPNLYTRACMRDLDQRARYPDDWHEHGWYMKRVRLFAWLAAIGLVGAVAWNFFL